MTHVMRPRAPYHQNDHNRISIRAVAMPPDAVKEFLPTVGQQVRVANDISSAVMRYNHGTITIGQWSKGSIQETVHGPAIIAEGYVHSVSQVPDAQQSMQRRLHDIIRESTLSTCSVGIDFFETVPRLFEVSLVDTPRFAGSTVELRASEEGGKRVRVHGNVSVDFSGENNFSKSGTERKNILDLLNPNIEITKKNVSHNLNLSMEENTFGQPVDSTQPVSSNSTVAASGPGELPTLPDAKKARTDKKEPAFSYDKAGNLITTDTRTLDDRLGLTAEKKEVLGEETVQFMRNTLSEHDKKTSTEMEALRLERDALLVERQRTEQEYVAAQAPRAKTMLAGLAEVGQTADEITNSIYSLAGSKAHSVFWEALNVKEKAFSQTKTALAQSKMQYTDLMKAHTTLQGEMNGLRAQTAKHARVDQMQQSAQRSAPGAMATGVSSMIDAGMGANMQMAPTTQLRASASGVNYDFNFNPFTHQNGAHVVPIAPHGDAFCQIMRPASAKNSI